MSATVISFAEVIDRRINKIRGQIDRSTDELAAIIAADRPDLSLRACQTIARKWVDGAGSETRQEAMPLLEALCSRDRLRQTEPFFMLVARIEKARPDLGWSAAVTAAHDIEKGRLTFKQVAKGEPLSQENVKPLVVLHEAFRNAEAAYNEAVASLAQRCGRSDKAIRAVVVHARKGHRLNSPT